MEGENKDASFRPFPSSHMASTDQPLSPSLPTPTDPLMGNNNLQESRHGDSLALYTALVRSYQLSIPMLIQTPTPACFLRPLHW
jgi:hypothetical protein